MSRTPIATWDTPRTSIASPPTGTPRDCTGLPMRNDRVVRRGVMSLLVAALLVLGPACGSDSPSAAPTSTSSTAPATATTSTASTTATVATPAGSAAAVTTTKAVPKTTTTAPRPSTTTAAKPTT